MLESLHDMAGDVDVVHLRATNLEVSPWGRHVDAHVAVPKMSECLMFNRQHPFRLHALL